MRRAEHVFLAVFAGVADESEGEVTPFAVELVNALAVAVFWNFFSFVGDGERVALRCAGAVDVDLAVVVTVDVEFAVSLAK